MKKEVARKKRGLAVLILTTILLIVLVSGCALKDTFSSAKNTDKFGEGPVVTDDSGTIVDQQEGKPPVTPDKDTNSQGPTDEPGKDNNHGQSQEQSGKDNQGESKENGNEQHNETTPSPDLNQPGNNNEQAEQTPGETGTPSKPDDKSNPAEKPDKDQELPNVGSSKKPDPVDKKKIIAITFDDGPDAKYTPAILDTLKEKGVKATFFVVGTQVEKYPEILQRIIDEGHAIGNHSYSHKDLTKLNKTQILSQIEATDKAIKAAIGTYPTAFRAPYGALNKQVRAILEEKGRHHVGWNVDTRDWAGTSIADMRKNIRENAKDNGIILMHSFGGKHIQNTVDMIGDVIDDLEKLGFTFVTTDELK